MNLKSEVATKPVSGRSPGPCACRLTAACQGLGPRRRPWPATGPGGARLLSLPLPRPFDLPWRGKHAGKGRKRPGSGEEGTSKTPDPSWLLLAT